MQVALAVRCAQLQLTVGIEIFAGNRNITRRLDHEQIGLARGLEFEAIGRAPGDDDIIKFAKRQRTEHRVQRAAAGMNEDHFVGIGIAKQALAAAVRGGSAPA